MHNLAFIHGKVVKTVSKPIPNFELVKQADGSFKSVVVENPYEGLSADSFTLDAQLAAGVPLSPCSPMSAGSIHSVDINNSNSRKFIDSLSKNN